VSLNNIQFHEKGKVSEKAVCHSSSTASKIALYKSLFRGRNDVFALKWKNDKSGKSGYSPVCKNKWAFGLCDMKHVPCSKCLHHEPVPLDNLSIYHHLRGDDPLCRDVVGLYPLLPDASCWFLALDFDEKDWKDTCTILRNICKDLHIPAGFEISRSGNGVHIWFFFDKPIPAEKARSFGSALLRYAMSQHHSISFASFDRMFPNQNTVPKGGYGNLIALPLQGQAVKQGHSVFVDASFTPYPDQWVFLSSLQRSTAEKIEQATQTCIEKTDPMPKKLQTSTPKASGQYTCPVSDFPSSVTLIFSNVIHIPKSGISERALSMLRRTAVFSNPEFYRAERMRMSVRNKPRFIDCSEETDDELLLPRGCMGKVTDYLTEKEVPYHIDDKRQVGHTVNVHFTGNLHPEQKEALEALLPFENGILSAGTGFGKTVTATALIAKRKVNTLIIVPTMALLLQWEKAIQRFLNLKPGMIGGGKDTSKGLIDIAIRQSLLEKDAEDVVIAKNLVRKYGMVLVDECHHVSAFSFELLIKALPARYIYGLTATPIRRDGHQPILFMECGPLRYQFDAKKLADMQGLTRYLVPRFTSFNVLEEHPDHQPSITEYYQKLAVHTYRNDLILKDVRLAVSQGRTPLVLSERVAHISWLAEQLKDDADAVISITGKGSAKEKRMALERLESVPPSHSLIVLATGRYIGEGFDGPRLDTLFLTMPISWKGVLFQYCGRLHRTSEHKKEVSIYDYVDFHVPLLERMYQRRLKGYVQMGYSISSSHDSTTSESTSDTRWFMGNQYVKNFEEDLETVKNQLIISSPKLDTTAVTRFITSAMPLMEKGIRIFVLTYGYPDKLQIPAHKKALVDRLSSTGIVVRQIVGLSQRCAVIDTHIVWYGSTNILGPWTEDDCCMRFENNAIASEMESLWNTAKDTSSD
jgi:superfamily II DNA or RNA helicase